MGQLSLSATFQCPAATLREYLGRVANIPAVTNPDLEIEIVEAPELITEGAEIAFSILVSGVRQAFRHRWTTATDQQIVTEQLQGPARSWRHVQDFSDTAAGCQLTESFEFEPPGGMLGFVITDDVISQSLEEGTHLRHQLLSQQLGL